MAASGVAFSGLAMAQSPANEIGILRRLIGRSAEAFNFRIGADGSRPWFAVNAADGHVIVSANSLIGALRGAYAYLNATGAVQTNWEGDRVVPPSRWPDLSIPRSETFFHHRAYLNPCTFGYTTPFWGWPRWERELDWMALHGIDMPLAMEGQEFVWRQLWKDAGLSDAELAAYFCGPAFLPWQRMGNIEGHGGPLPNAFIEKKRDLQLRILERARDLGMKPILPAFAGYVPKAFALRHSDAHIHKMTPWGGFRETYWLDPTDPLFAKLARGFIERYTAVFGSGEFYLADAFNEMRPPVSGKTISERTCTLSQYGGALHQSLNAARPGAVLVMQAWLFGIDPEFWDEGSVAAFLRDIPEDKLLVLDIANDTYPGVWEKTKAFSGKSWIFGYIHDFGGNNPLFGDLPLVKKDIGNLPTRDDKGRLEGFGVFPEGLNTNSIIYEFMFDRAWPAAASPDDIDAWLTDYLKARYGKTDPALLSVWGELWRAVYQVPNWRTGYWKGSFGQYLFCKRPDQALAGFEKEPGDIDQLRAAVATLSSLSPAYGDASLFRYDLIAAASHYASLHMDRMLLAMLRSFAAGDIEKGEATWKSLRRLALRIDDILGAQPFTLARWIEDARRYASSPGEEKIYIENAKLQITLWGGDAVLKDYASKAWAGMYRYFCLPRWSMYVRAQRAAFRAAKSFNQVQLTADLIRWETAWTQSPRSYPSRPPARPFAAVTDLLAECARGEHVL